MSNAIAHCHFSHLQSKRRGRQWHDDNAVVIFFAAKKKKIKKRGGWERSLPSNSHFSSSCFRALAATTIAPGGQFHPIHEIPERDFLDGALMGAGFTQAKEQDCLCLDCLDVCWLLLGLPVYHCLTCSSLCRVLTPDHWSKRPAGSISVDSCHEPFKNAMCCEEIFIKGSPLVHLYQVLRSPSQTPKFCKASKKSNQFTCQKDLLKTCYNRWSAMILDLTICIIWSCAWPIA
jgi:hypothetical protein